MKKIASICFLSFFFTVLPLFSIDSVGLPFAKKLEILKEYMIIKSDLIDIHYSIYDANKNPANRSSIPGPTDRDYKVILLMKSEDIQYWINDKENWITSSPIRTDWINDIKLDKALKKKISQSSYSIYSHNEDGIAYILWINEKEGIVLIHYVQK